MGKWNEEKIINELDIISKQIGHFPTHRELGGMNRNDLRCAITLSKKPIAYYAEKLGFEHIKPMNYWTEETIISELKKIIDETGKFPSVKNLEQTHGGLWGAIYGKKYKIEYFQKLLGFQSIIKIDWTEEKITEELKKITEKLGYFPTTNEIQKENKSLNGAISKTKKSIHYYAKLLGFEPNEKPKGYWKDFENLKKEINEKFKDMLEIKKFPTLDMIKRNIKGNVVVAVCEFGGINVVANLMGYEPPTFYTTTDGHYVQSSHEYLLDEYLYSRGIQHEVNGLIPNSNYKYDFKVGDYYIEIWGYESNRPDNKICAMYNEKRKLKEEAYKSSNLNLISINSDVFKKPLKEVEEYFENLFKSLGFDTSLKKLDFDIINITKYCGYWSVEKIKLELEEIINKLGDFPTRDQISTPGLNDAIKMHGGITYFRELFGYDLLRKPGHYWNKDTITAELKPIVEKLGRFPVQADLEAMDKHDLIKGINRQGGYHYYRELLGFESIKRKDGFWSEEKVLSDLKEICDKIGHFPTCNELRTINKTLSSAIDRHKFGLLKLKEKLNYK